MVRSTPGPACQTLCKSQTPCLVSPRETDWDGPWKMEPQEWAGWERGPSPPPIGVTSGPEPEANGGGRGRKAWPKSCVRQCEWQWACGIKIPHHLEVWQHKINGTNPAPPSSVIHLFSEGQTGLEIRTPQVSLPHNQIAQDHQIPSETLGDVGASEGDCWKDYGLELCASPTAHPTPTVSQDLFPLGSK